MRSTRPPMTTLIAITAAAITAVALTACGAEGGTRVDVSTSSPVGSTPAVPPSTNRDPVISVAAARAPGGDPWPAGAAVAIFGAALMTGLQTEGNVVISPYSAYQVLAMTSAGAAGATKSELDAALGTGPEEGRDTAAEMVTAVDDALTVAENLGRPTKHNTGSVTIDLANSLWVQNGMTLRPEFLDTLARGFGTGVVQTDYASDPERARAEINKWVADRTNAVIPELLPKDLLTTETRLTLVNALYFAGHWATEFGTVDPLAFNTSKGKVSAAGMRTRQHLAYSTGPGWQAVTIPYRGEGIGMTLIVPDAGQFDTISRSLAPDVLFSGMTGEVRDVDLTMPRFAIRTSVSLVDPLKKIGITTLFGSGATKPDLSGIAGAEAGLSVSDVLQQAVIQVDEKGTVAAAATAEMLAGATAPTDLVTLTVDRPFLFVIQDARSHAPLFLGRVLDPTA